MIPSALITGPSTGAGKTVVTRALAAALHARGLRVAALKPIETGVDTKPLDAVALARAAGDPSLARAPGLYRARPGLAPYAAALETGAPAPDLVALSKRVRELSASADVLLVEGAGGLLVPLDARHSFADLAQLLQLPLVLVARDQLGVLSHVLTCFESARARGLRVAAVILSQHPESSADASTRTNHRILQERLECPVRRFPACPDDDTALAAAAERLGLLATLALV